jgi:hypothetical protein
MLEHLKKVIHKLYPNLNFSPNYCMTDCEVAVWSVNISMFLFIVIVLCYLYIYIFLFFKSRDALESAFPNSTHLMCYFHVMKACKECLRSYTADVQ